MLGIVSEGIERNDRAEPCRLWPGYCGAPIARAAREAGYAVATVGRGDEANLSSATHVLSTVAPHEAGDPILMRHGTGIAEAPSLRWIGYLSTTGVYGDRGGAWVDEATPAGTWGRALAAPPRRRGGMARCRRHARHRYLPAGRHLRPRPLQPSTTCASAKRPRIDKPNHTFGRIHRDDIVAAVLAAMAQDSAPWRAHPARRRRRRHPNPRR